MCGIAGIISREGDIVPNRIEKMISAIRHRGPDDVGYYKINEAHLSMCRLSIIDLQSEGLCPLIHRGNKRNDIALTYNGEIYNYIELRQELEKKGYQFKTTSDSEVLLNAYREWGDNCVDKFNGMFAFAILDIEKDILFIARDRAGEKPLYYYQNNKEFIFASEIKALLTQIETPDINLNDEFKSMEFLSGEETLFDGVKSLLPGHKLIYKGVRNGYKGRRIVEYWNVLDYAGDVSNSQAVDKLDALLHNSISLRLRSDVPWGLYLSGGIDSALIAYYARPKICFTCHFPYGPKYDELSYARQVANDIKAELVIVEPTQQDFEETIADVMYHLDMPVGSYSAFPLFMLARKASEMVKIVLSGEGSDELFSGYTRYLLLAHEQELYHHKAMMNYKPLLDYYWGHAENRFAHLLNRGNVSDDLVKAIISKHFEQFDDVIHAMGYTEFKLTLVSLLQMEDRMSAAFGIENRTPFLDHRIIEFAFSIPSNTKIISKIPKWIVRELAKRYLPKALIDREDKKGLIAPINLWIHATGARGEFDRHQYNKLCMDKWLEVFFKEKRFNFPSQRIKNLGSSSI